MGMYSHCRESGDEEKGSFHASKEWLEKLQKYCEENQHLLIMWHFRNIIIMKHYLSQKIFNLDKTA
jgi:ribosomal protein S19